MNKKLPSVFVNMQDKPINNNMNFYYSKNKKEVRETKEKTFFDKIKVNKKINDLFASPHFVYKLPVSIKLENEVVETFIVSKKGNNLVTLDNKMINIDNIIDINEV